MAKYNLDEQDKIIIRHLQNDGRKSYKDIADEIGVSNVLVHNRFKKLIKENILHIIGWANPENLGLNCHALVLLDIRTSKHLESAIKSLSKLEWVDMLTITAGEYILEVELLCRDNEHLFEVVNKSILNLEGITDSHVTTFLEVYMDNEDHGTKMDPIFRGNGNSDKDLIKLDETNLKLIQQIQKNGRKSYKDMAKDLNVSVNTIRTRYQVLEDEDVIDVYGWVQPPILGFGTYCRILIFLSSIKRLKQVVLELAKIDNVRFIASSSEKHHLEITMMCKNNLHLQQVRINEIHGIEGVVNTEVILYLKVLVHNGNDVKI